MDDPWAAPSASASTSKVLAAMTMPTSPPRPPRMSFSPPPEQLDVADPWGAPAKVPVSPKWEPRKSWEARPSWDGERERESTSSPVIDEGWGTPEPGLEQHDTVSSARPSFERRSLELKASESLRVSLDEPAEAQAADTALELSSMGHASSPARVASPPLDTSFARLSHEEPSHEEPSHEEPSQSFADISLSSVQASSMRRSPSFGGGSDFGDFGTGAGDPWGAGGTSWKDATEGGWGQEVELQREGEEDTQKGWGAERDSEPSTARGWDQEASWGGARAASPPPQASKQEEDWEAEQRRVALSEQRAPFELITRLKKDWESVAADVAGDSVLETSEEAEAALASGAAELEDNVRETLRGLTDPPDTTFAYATSLTREKYSSALSRAAPNATSLLRVPVRATRYEGLEFGTGQAGWGARSHLGEPEAPMAAAAATEDGETSRGWSFWRRGTTPRPLVTSGGGMLEVKSESITPLPETPAASSELSGVLPEPTSRPASIAPAPALTANVTGTPTIATVPSRESSIQSRSGTPDVRPGTPSSVAEEKPAPQRAASGFWGRFRRRQVVSDEPQGLDQEDHELELGENDFAFLAEVPSIPQQGTDDLLGMDGPMASLDSVLGPKAVPLPAPLAPPPKSNNQAQPSFQARMAAPQKKASDLDLLSGPDFDGPGEVVASDAAAAPSSAFNWEELLAPSTATIPPAKAPTPVPRLASPPQSASPIPRLASPPQRSSSPVPRTSSPLAGPPMTATAKSSTLSSLSPTQSATMSSMFDLDPTASKPTPAPSVFDLTPARSSSTFESAFDLPSNPSSDTSRRKSVALNFGFAGGLTSTEVSPPKPAGSPSPFGDLSSFASLAPSTPAPKASNPSTMLSAPPLQPTPRTPPQTDDFGDFGDFGSFGTTSLDDDFGDFTSSSPAPPTPIAKSAAPTPIAKSPAYGTSALPLSTPSPRGATSSTTPVFSRPANLPTGLRGSPRLASDHTPTLELLTAAATQEPTERDAQSPIAPALAPPPGPSFAFPPPPGGRNIDLLGDL